MNLLRRVEETVSSVCLMAMVALPVAEFIARGLFSTSVPGSGPIVQHLTLWVAFLGAALAAREGKLLAFATGQLLPEGRLRSFAAVFSSAVAVFVAALLSRAGLELAWIERDAGTLVGGIIPAWVVQMAIPVAFALIAVRMIARAGTTWRPRALTAIGALAGLLLGQNPLWIADLPTWPLITLLLLGTLLGGPIFAVLGGAAAVLFMADGVPPMAVLAETYRLTVSPTLAAVPLFTLVGFFLAKGQSSHRLVRLFRALFGWAPGGTAVVCALVCAFFTVPTGGSGVTILALGGLLFQALREDGYPERFSLGLLTASGSLGLLLPPALPLILYGIVANVPIEDLFLGGVLPGTLLILLVAAWGIRQGWVSGITRTAFDAREARAAIWEARWELLLPVIAIVTIFGGFATFIEAAALTAAYTFLYQTLGTGDLSPRRDLRPLLVECLVLLGGVLLILGVAMGLTSWLVDAQIPNRALLWMQGVTDSPLMFLLGLNLFLLLVGCFMDIFSATVVVVPLIAPLGAAFGIDPVHLGIIFVANLELGYLTPPVGLNLFLASYRFERPILTIYRSTWPMLVILGLGVLLITYVPALTTGILTLLGRR